MTRSIAELQAAGVVFNADEAVAIAQQLMAGLRASPHADEAAPPFGPPSAGNVFLNDDGSVVCRGCTATLAVSEVGIFLESLLGHGSPRVPGGLRYTIARALLNVDVRPFDSLAAFAQDLARHEQGDRAAAVTRALRRADRSAAVAIAARLFEQEHRLPRPQVIDLAPASPPAAPPERAFTAAAACVAAGLALIGAGELVHHPRAAMVAPVNATARIEAPPPAIVRTAAPVATTKSESVRPVRSLVAVRTPVRHQVGTARPARRVALVKRPPQPERGVMDRLKLGWLRRALTVHSDL